MLPLDVLVPVAGLALLDTLSPAVIGVSLYVLLSGSRSVARPLLAYLGTVAAFYLALGCALMLGLGFALDRLGGLLDDTALGWVLTVAGGGALVFSFFMSTGPRPRRPASLRTGAMVALGLGTGVLEGATALPYFGAIALLTAADPSPLVWLPVLAAYNLVMVLPGVLLYLGLRALGERARPRLERWRAKVESGGRGALPWIVGIAGFLLLRQGLWLTGALEGLGATVG
ncbi:Sap, sulfolipid-1-addressing protein [Nocardiopsis flavescens]|uniref:Sap, sulfolipid-1-addressing protein n=1 Tax=Nocardiopsis flavescens TaxID=758803 RepID=A0A1M6AQ59_9ACTN|nr:GAP family protein [Nocardiopsis flavescens]SHI38659.1 Sap, sulfolipid-1-addressing protein [Nocardiopsis flavescens]